jgi:release factor glutamine methyltransferase
LPKLAETIRTAAGLLTANGIDNPAPDARLLVAHALRIDRAQLLAQPERTLTDEEQRRIDDLLARRMKREPMARILGSREFWGLDFRLNEATLIPRPESETLIEAALAGIGGLGFGIGKGETLTPKSLTPRLLDLGTGSGCLLLALLHELPNATGLGIDAAPRALEQAQANAENLGMTSRATFKFGDWMQNIEERFDIIISNPPYIAASDIPALMPEVRDFDPRLALDGGADGLDIYRKLIPELPHHLNPNGIAVFEVGQGQADAVQKLFLAAGFKNVSTRKDLGGIERCVIGIKE